MPRSVFTFHTTHHALWAEELAAENAIPAEIVPAPPEAGARCDLALETLPTDRERLSLVLLEEGVEFSTFAC
jgi:hypothetical protein